MCYKITPSAHYDMGNRLYSCFVAHNACIESFHALIEREWLNRCVIKNIKYAHDLIFEYIEVFYNTVRIHNHCNMKSPYDYEETFIS